MVNTLTTEGLKIWVAPSGTLGAALSASGTEITSLYTNYSRSGLERDFDSTPVGNGGFIDVIKTLTQGELTIDLTATDDTDKDLFHKLDSGDIDAGMIAFQYGTSTDAMWSAYNNCKQSIEFEHSSDSELKGTLTLKFSPASKLGNWNMASYTGAEIDDETNGLLATTTTTFEKVTKDTSWSE